jgi:hypothetical protein
VKVAKRFFATPIDRRTHRDIIRDPSTGRTKSKAKHDCICGKRLQAFLLKERGGDLSPLAVVSEVFFEK